MMGAKALLPSFPPKIISIRGIEKLETEKNRRKNTSLLRHTDVFWKCDELRLVFL